MTWLTDRHRILIGRAMAVASVAISVAAVAIHLLVDARSLYSEWVLHNSVGGVVINQPIDARGADEARIMRVMPAMLKVAEDSAVARIIQLTDEGRLR